MKAPIATGQPLDGKDLSPLLLRDKADWPERMIFATIRRQGLRGRTQQYRLDAGGSAVRHDRRSRPNDRRRRTTARGRQTTCGKRWPTGARKFCRRTKTIAALSGRLRGVPDDAVAGAMACRRRHPPQRQRPELLLLHQLEVQGRHDDVGHRRAYAGTYRVAIQYACPEKDLAQPSSWASRM